MKEETGSWYGLESGTYKASRPFLEFREKRREKTAYICADMEFC